MWGIPTKTYGCGIDLSISYWNQSCRALWQATDPGRGQLPSYVDLSNGRPPGVGLRTAIVLLTCLQTVRSGLGPPLARECRWRRGLLCYACGIAVVTLGSTSSGVFGNCASGTRIQVFHRPNIQIWDKCWGQTSAFLGQLGVYPSFGSASLGYTWSWFFFLIDLSSVTLHSTFFFSDTTNYWVWRF